MWAHLYQCTKCNKEVKMITNSSVNPMKDRVGLHLSMYGNKDEISAYYNGAEVETFKYDKGKTCTGTLKYNFMASGYITPVEAYDPTAKILVGSVGEVTDELWEELPEDLQKRMLSVLNTTAAKQGEQGVKALTGKPKFKGVEYTYELKFLGAYGNHRCYGNKVGNLVKFTVYDPDGSLH
ncbi:MAG: hypothetical protein JST36_02640 [Bacteroidetes bacterium]|nr:hypothetical protein [Bacteroidota bacterium]